MLTRILIDRKPMKDNTKPCDIREAKISNDPKVFIEGYAKRVAENALLISKYPFLLPLNFEYKVDSKYDFSYTEADMVPDGWKNLIIDLSEELMEFFHRKGIDPYRFHIDQLKEKFGTIRLYHNFDNAATNISEEIYLGIENIIRKYEELSEHTCCICGGEATLMSKGWICPYCKSCAEDLKKEQNAHWEFTPLEKSTWTKIEIGEAFGKKQ